MTALAAVGIHNDLASSETTIPHGSADYKTTSGIDVVHGLIVQHILRDRLANHLLDNPLPEGIVLHLGYMLGCHHHGVNSSGSTVFVFHRNLRLAVGAEKVQRPTSSGLAPNAS